MEIIMFKRRKKVLIAIIVVISLISGYFIINAQNESKQIAKLESNLINVESGSITDKVKGTGVVSANEKYDITSLVPGKIISSNYKEGDSVGTGQILYTIDSSELNKQIKTAQIMYDKSEENYRQSVKAKDDLITTSLYSGKIQKLYVSKGDFVTSGSKIADIIDSNNLILKIPFNTVDIGKISLGATANITLVSNSASMQGIVSRIYDTSESLDNYKNVTYIEVTVRNPGAITKGEKAYATVNGIGCNSAGEFINLVEKSIVSKGNGQIAELNALEGSFINAGTIIMKLQNDQITNAITNSGIAVKEAKNALDNLSSQLDNYKIKSPASGTVVARIAKTGDNIIPGTVLISVSDINNLYVDVEIDEIFISKVQLGQKTSITAEALPNQTFTGEVIRINDVGVAKNGVTYYPVKVKIDKTEALKVGMNLNVSIIIQTKDNVTLLPKDAVDGNKVMLYENSKLREVKIETGIKDDKFIEILSGLNVGDRIDAKSGK